MPRLFISDRDGWMREFKLDKSLIYLGSDPRCDVVLDSARGSGIAARHAQLLASTSRPGGRRLVNLSDIDVPLGNLGEFLPSRAATEIAPGAVFRLGEYPILLRADEEPMLPQLSGGRLIGAALPALAAPEGPIGQLPPAGGTGGMPAFVLARGGGTASSDKIGMQVTLSSPLLAPDLPIEDQSAGWSDYADAVLDTACRVERLQLGHDLCLYVARDAVQPDQRGIADQLQ